MIERFMRLVCRRFHSKIMWPMNHHYECSTCHRWHPTPEGM